MASASLKSKLASPARMMSHASGAYGVVWDERSICGLTPMKPGRLPKPPARLPLVSFGITSVEQPVPHADVEQLADLRRQIQAPIMLDESLCGLFDAEQAVEHRTCDLFNFRLSKCGGFIPTLPGTVRQTA